VVATSLCQSVGRYPPPHGIYGIDEDMALLAFDLFSRVVAVRIDATPPFSALFTL